MLRFPENLISPAIISSGPERCRSGRRLRYAILWVQGSPHNGGGSSVAARNVPDPIEKAAKAALVCDDFRRMQCDAAVTEKHEEQRLFQNFQQPGGVQRTS
jgi:hypothetical protein